MTRATGPLLGLLLVAGSASAAGEILVAADGSGRFASVQAAIDSLPARTEEPVVIRLKPGVYAEHVSVARGRDRIALVGEDAAATTIVDRRPASFGGGTYESATLAVYADDFSAEGITFENSYGRGTQALAVAAKGRRIQFRGCRFVGWQDTLRIDAGPMYFVDCHVEGHCDYVYGGATAWFERCRIHSKADGFVTAASTPQEAPFGYVFSRCDLTAAPDCTRVFLGRPWRDHAAVAWLDSRMDRHILPVGWDNWSEPRREGTVRYLEHGSLGPGGDTSARARWPGVRILSDEEAAGITLEAVLGDWVPTFIDERRPGRAARSAPPAGGEDAPREWPDAADGFASVEAMGQNGTVGGAGGATVTVSDQEALERYAAAGGPHVIRVAGAITVRPKGREIRVASDKTIVGVGRAGEIVGGGFLLRPDVRNVIIRNLTVRDSFVEGDGDGKTQDFDGVQMDAAHHVWIDHCRFSRLGDGMIDSRKDTTYLTVSWCVFSDHNKTFGVGWTSNVTAQMTIHHNWFRDVEQRNPAVDNVLRAHLYNNFLRNVKSYGHWARGGTNMVVQNSVFENVNRPHFVDRGTLVATGNVYRGKVARSGPDEAATRRPAFFDPGEYYKYSLDDAADVPDILARYAGPQENIGR